MRELIDLRTLNLQRGAHGERERGMCLMEAVAWMAGEPHSDRPKCADVALAAFGRRLNDAMTEVEREMLVPLVPELVGTNGTQRLSMRRAFLLVDRIARRAVPSALRALGRDEWASKMENAAPIVDEHSARNARAVFVDVRTAAADADAYVAAAAAAAAYVAAAAAAAAAYAAAAACLAAAAAAAAAYVAAAIDAAAYVAAAAADAADAAAREQIMTIATEAFAEAIALQSGS